MKAHGWYAHDLKMRRARRDRNRCAARGCEHQARFYLNETFGRRKLCAHHWRLQGEQLEIVERIRSL